MARDEAGADRVRVIVGEDHPLMLNAVVGRLGTDPSIELVGTATDGRELVELYRQQRPDVVLADYQMPELSGVEIVRSILALDHAARVLIFSAYDDPASVAAGLGEGAAGYVSKSADSPELLEALHAVARGEQRIDRAVLDKLLEQAKAPSSASKAGKENPLSKREQEVLILVSKGSTSADIAERLFISPHTVKTHLNRIYGKLEVSQRAAAVRKAIERGFIR